MLVSLRNEKESGKDHKHVGIYDQLVVLFHNICIDNEVDNDEYSQNGYTMAYTTTIGASHSHAKWVVNSLYFSDTHEYRVYSVSMLVGIFRIKEFHNDLFKKTLGPDGNEDVNNGKSWIQTKYIYAKCMNGARSLIKRRNPAVKDICKLGNP